MSRQDPAPALSDCTPTRVGRAPSGQALAVPSRPASGLDASRFDPSRIHDEFRAWVWTQPADEEYCYESNGNCAFARFLVASGVVERALVGGTNWDDAAGKTHDFPDDIRLGLLREPRTFGALAARLTRGGA